jgi:hypothetical protein
LDSRASGSVSDWCVWLERFSLRKVTVGLPPPLSAGGSFPDAVPFFAGKLFRPAQASTSVPSTVKRSSLSSRFCRAWLTIREKNSSATAPSSDLPPNFAHFNVRHQPAPVAM